MFELRDVMYTYASISHIERNKKNMKIWVDNHDGDYSISSC